MGLLETGYAAFTAVERDHNDGAQECAAVLTATNAAGSTKYYGQSSKNSGHGELHALNQFLYQIGYNVATFGNYALTIECVSKPCCKHCSAIMGLLGIVPTVGTNKVWKSMGVSYAIPPDVRTFLKNHQNCSAQKIIDDLCG